ncbi:hypothetical protein FRC10_002031 [Ceratobasidium sp. 414]|nr:hypothetical protein FRC10_002031 [Ceratobasidium sp. 414]
MPSTLPASNRLLPFARDHDRLLVALLYLDHQEFGISILNRRIERLKLRQAWLAQCIIFKEAKMAEIQASRDIPEEQKREFLGALVEVIRTARNGIDEARRYTDNVTVERDQAQANLSHRQKVSRLLANLYSSAFNGDTPEFPHEDRLEALVAAAELESAKCFQANDTLADQGRRVLQMNGIIGELAKLLEHVHLSIRARDGQAVEYALLENRWREALRLYNDLKDLTRQPMDDQSSCPLHQIDEVDNVEDFLRAMNNAAHAAGMNLRP